MDKGFTPPSDKSIILVLTNEKREMIMTDFNASMENLLTSIGEDYRRWTSRSEYGTSERADEFVSELSVEKGRKYAKVISGRSVWGFVMMNDDSKFKKGDILMAAGWASPARNKPRGNIFEGYPNISWTGPGYL